MAHLKHLALYILAIYLLLPLAGCIENDIPYPRLRQDILSIAAAGENAPSSINTAELTAVIHLGEDVNPKSVTFTEFSYTEGADCSKNLLEGTYDLTEPLQVTLSLYQNYVWTITAEQHIERFLSIAGQIGETAIDVVGKRIVLYVPKTTNLHTLTLSAIKLGPTGKTTMTPDLKSGDIIDCSKPLQIQVKYFDQTEIWTLYVDKSEALVTTTQADAWVNVVWAYGTAPEDATNSFQYREVRSDTWIDVEPSSVQHNGGSFSVCIPHLSPMTEYAVRAVSDNNIGNEIIVKTGVGMDLPNASFDAWWKDGKVWCPWAEDTAAWWDTGNTGASTLGQSNVVPSENTPSGSGMSAMLETRFVGIGAIGKLAAGSIYAGSFVRVDGTNGILDFGRTWEACPTKIRGYYNYSPTPINYVSTEFNHLMGRTDSCHMWVALTDMSAPWQIRTNPKDRQLFDRNDPRVIAYGEITSAENTNGWKPFEITLEYKSTSRKPTYILAVFAASKYGDYFTGGAGTVLYIDDLSIHYDY